MPAASHFRAGTAADKAQNRPSLQGYTPARVSFDSGGGGGDSTGYFQIITSLAIDDTGNITEPSATCDTSIFGAPWYWAEGNFSLPVANDTIVNVCTPPVAHHRWNQPFPSTSPLPTPTPTTLYVLKVDIGWFSLSGGAIAGPAALASSQWTFPELEYTQAFNDDHLYAYFVANWTGSNPPPIAP